MNRTLPPFLQELFDRGIDPLEDAAARAWLEQHPDHLQAFASLRALLHEVGEVPPVMTWPRRRWPFWVAAGAAAVLVGIAVFGLYAAAVPGSGPGSGSPLSTVLPRPQFAPRAQVRSCATTESTVAGGRQFVLATEQGTLSRRASTIRSTTSTEPQLPTVFLRTTVFETTIRP